MKTTIKAIFPIGITEEEAIAKAKKYGEIKIYSFNPVMFQGTKSFACLVMDIDDSAIQAIEADEAFKVDFLPEITQCPSPNNCGTKGKCC